MKMKRLFSSKTVLLIWFGFALFFFTAQIGIFKITSRVGDQSVIFSSGENLALNTQVQTFYKGKHEPFNQLTDLYTGPYFSRKKIVLITVNIPGSFLNVFSIGL